MSNLNPQQEIRASLCQQYLHAGQHEASQIIANVQALESFIFGDQSNAPVIKNAEVKKSTKTEQPKAETKAVEATEVEQPTETETTDVPAYTSADVRNALVNLAKQYGKESVASILSAVGAATVPAIAESDYPKVMSLIDAKQKEAA